MHLEEFAEGNSFFHKLDPRVKFLSFMPYITIIAVHNSLKIAFLALFISIIFIIIAKLKAKIVLHRIGVVNIFTLFLWLFIPFTKKGNAIFNIGTLIVYKESIYYVSLITLKTNAIVLATISILGTSDIFSLAHGLIHLKIPKKLIHLFFFFYRYISVLHEEYIRLRRAMIVRCFSPKTNLHTYKSIAYLIGMLLVKSYERSQRIYQAMLCRGYNGNFPIYRHFKTHKKDFVFMIIIYFITGVFLYFK